ncbi:PAS domain-containing protein [Wolbachia endosymbiont of Dirofilaria (Dirofilaria) immitis]|uniref:PAS domain-containing protein n=1 Tax=Wolbachia endosymbiont of Dirofilaria (Dirofilaria) immitis TaxID=1812115 RepID=UPI00158C7D45|nr:PAS domain-containing protein [Wolbachia endosymbiont of Dirofilaria (Dirofilaria) immitis]QKX02150.1 PAS domain-containing protein [Wolbachia endosymbiont of Dirofilaria (Dirofilaria) immitis]
MKFYIGKERRIANIVTQYWSEVKGPNRNWPGRHEIDVAEIVESWQHCFIIEVNDCGYICENAGRKAIEFYGFEKSMRIDSKYAIDALFLHLYKIDVIIDKFDAVVDGKCLINEEEESESVKMRQVLLPLGNKKDITHILGLVTFKLL